MIAVPLLVVTVSTTVGLAQAGATGTAPVALDRIAADGTHLFDSVTGKAFVPRGASYVRLQQDSTGVAYHATFEPNAYDPTGAQGNLDYMESSGYNTVRVFIDPGGATVHGDETDPAADGLSDAYMSNFLDFTTRAAADHIYVIPVLDAFPQDTRYFNIVKSVDGGQLGRSDITGHNLYYLDPGYAATKKQYLTDFATRVVNAGLATDILAYETDNEVYFDGNALPYKNTTGTFADGTDGASYDLGTESSRQASADSDLVQYTVQARAGLSAADPGALMTIGFFLNSAVGRTGYTGIYPCATGADCRYPGNLANTDVWGKANFVDVHYYPSGVNSNFAAAMNSSSAQFATSKPLILGEIGASRTAFPSITNAANTLRTTQTTSCGYNPEFQGGELTWTWDSDTSTPTSTLAGQGGFWSVVDNSGAINGQLAPIARPNPCQ